MQRTLVVLAIVLGTSVVGYFVYRWSRENTCDSVFQQTATSLETKLDVIKANGSVVVGEKGIQELTERSQIVGLNLKTCCILLQGGSLSAEQFFQCKRGADEYVAKVEEVSTVVREAKAAPQHIEQKRVAAAATVASATAISNDLEQKVATFPTSRAGSTATLVPSTLSATTLVAPPPPPSSPAIVPKDASADRTAPTAFAPGEIVKGRLPASQSVSHYWRIQVPAGKFDVFFEVARADEQISNIQTRLDSSTPDGVDLGWSMDVNDIDKRFRTIGRMETGPQGQELILRVTNATAIVDYWIGIFPPGTKDIPAPFFARLPTLHPIELGKPVSFSLDGRTPEFERYYTMKLGGSDYQLSVDLRRADGASSNVMGNIDVLNGLGSMLMPHACPINELNVAAKCTTKLPLVEPTDVIFRIRAGDNTAYQASLTVAPWP